VKCWQKKPANGANRGSNPAQFYAGQKQLIQHLINGGILKTKKIINAFKKVDRKDFVKEQYTEQAYEDRPLPIDHEQTISQPTTVAFMLELLQPQEGDRVLDVGSGSGWTTALLAQLVGQKGRVWGLEIVPKLVEFGKKNLKKYDFSQAEIQKAGPEPGLVTKAPFDKILVSAAAEDLPQILVDQLKVGGRLVIPIRDSIWRIDKISSKNIKKQEFFGFSFVPLK